MRQLIGRVTKKHSVRAAILGLLCAVWSALSFAHPMPESRVWIDTIPSGLRLTLQLPLNRLEFAFGHPLTDNPQGMLSEHGEALSTYLLQHVGARSANVGWLVQRPNLKVVGNDASAELEAVLELRPPGGFDSRSPTLLYDVITHQVRTHSALVFLRNDWTGGFAGQSPQQLGELRYGQNSLPIVLQQAGMGASQLSFLWSGAKHIAEGTDHLLFLFMLTIVAPLTASAARARRWSGVRPLGEGLRNLAWVVTAFTLGHSVTLALGSTGVVVLPPKPIEVAVAASILVAVAHALRPLFKCGEAYMALGFGLIHGFAFSASLSSAGLSTWQHAQALFAFNLGIEIMQLAVLLVVMPPLLIISRNQPTQYAALRCVAAVATGVLATFWIIERLGADPSAATAWLSDTPAVVLVIPVLAWLFALVALRRSRAVASASNG